MSTLAIPPKQVRLYRMLWDRWIIVLRILFDLGAGAHPVRWQAVADTLLVDKKTAQKYLQGLVRDGQIAPTGGGYMLTQAGMDILLENEGGESLPENGEKFLGKNSQLLESVVVVDSESKLISTTTTTTESGENLPRIFSPEVQAALDHADLLFDGAIVMQENLPYYLHIEKVLGWLAYCYDNRGRLYGPAGLVRKNLKDPSEPSPSMKYMKNPLAFLPDDYLSAIGKYHKVCDRCEQEFATLQQYEAHLEGCAFTRIPETDEMTTEARPSPDETITEAVRDNWRDVLVNLQGEMPAASFHTWVEWTEPIHYEDGVLQVAARNAYARDWLESRLSARVQELFGCRVLFVAGVAAETEDE